MAVQKCFISARYGQQLFELQSACEDKDINWQWAQTSPVGTPFADTVFETIAKSSFVIAVISGEEPAPNVMLEIGIAIGHKRPVLLLLEGDTPPPAQLNELMSFNTDLKDIKLLSFQIELFLRTLPKPIPRRVASSQRNTEYLTSEVYPVSAPTWTDTTPGSKREQEVFEIIQRVGGHASIPARREEKSPDFLMWLEKQDRELFTPAAIEIKERLTVDSFKGLQSWMEHFIVKSGLSCGLIIVAEPILPPFLDRVGRVPVLFPITLRDFRTNILLGQLGTWVRHERNRLAHGVR